MKHSTASHSLITVFSFTSCSYKVKTNSPINWYKLQTVIIAINRFVKLLQNISEDKVFIKDGKVWWKCLNRGYVYESEKALENCPVCLHPKAFMQVSEDNYWQRQALIKRPIMWKAHGTSPHQTVSDVTFVGGGTSPQWKQIKYIDYCKWRNLNIFLHQAIFLPAPGPGLREWISFILIMTTA